MPTQGTGFRPKAVLLVFLSFLSLLLVVSTGGSAYPAGTSQGDSLHGPSRASPLSWPALMAISIYQKSISQQQGQVCAFQPTCSHFAQQALRKHGLLQGALISSDRLQRCHYCAAGHYPVSETGHADDPIEGHCLWGADLLSSTALREISPPFGEERRETQRSFADHLSATGDYIRAHDQYRNLSATLPQDAQAGWALLRAGLCLQQAGRWFDAMRIFDQLAHCGRNSALAQEAAFQAALTRYLAGDANEALWRAAMLTGTSRGDRAALLIVWIHLSHGKWAQATAVLSRLKPLAQKEISTVADSLRQSAVRGPHLRQRNPALAAMFSAIVPGSGKWYAGKTLDGLYSLLLVGSSVAVSLAYARDEQWMKSGTFGAMGLFFHLGNIYGSAVEARQFSSRVRQSTLQHVAESVHAERWFWDLGEIEWDGAESSRAEGNFDLAETLFSAGQFDAAITEYKRHLFCFPEDRRQGLAHYKIGLSYSQQGFWEEARAELGKVSTQESYEDLRYKSRLRIAQIFLSQGSLAQGRTAIRELLADPLLAGRKDRGAEVQYWLGVCALQQGRWVEATGIFHGMEQRTTVSEYAQRVFLLSRAAREGFHLPKRSPALATALSFILPGSGQTYCGHLWNGLLSLALNAGTGYLTVDAFRDGRRLDGTLLASLLWVRFYFGGQQNAARFAREFNDRTRERHLSKYGDLLTPEYRE